jgi:hypothetical protein
VQFALTPQRNAQHGTLQQAKAIRRHQTSIEFILLASAHRQCCILPVQRTTSLTAPAFTITPYSLPVYLGALDEHRRAAQLLNRMVLRHDALQQPHSNLRALACTREDNHNRPLVRRGTSPAHMRAHGLYGQTRVLHIMCVTKCNQRHL